jgi:hypothetical protein
MMDSCCADGKVGTRTAIEEAGQWQSIDPNATTVKGEKGGEGVGGDEGRRIERGVGEAGEGESGTVDDRCVSGFMSDVNKVVEDMFVSAGVDVHVTAHQHVYERTTPVYRYQAYGNGSDPFPSNNTGSIFDSPIYPIYINNGCAGNVEL